MESERESDASDGAGPGATRALLVEDRADERDALRRLVEGRGFAVACASSLAEARRALREREFEVVLLDPDALAGLGIHVGMSADDAERILTLATLDRYKQKKRTAEVLRISLKTLYNRLKRYEVQGVPGPR